MPAPDPAERPDGGEVGGVAVASVGSDDKVGDVEGYMLARIAELLTVHALGGAAEVLDGPSCNSPV